MSVRSMGERDQLVSEIEFRKLFLGNPSTPAASEGLLSLSSRHYREYADEWKQSAQTASSDPARQLSLKMADIWLEAATQCEAGLATNFTERGEEAGAARQASPNDSAVRFNEPHVPRLELEEADRLMAWVKAA